MKIYASDGKINVKVIFHEFYSQKTEIHPFYTKNMNWFSIRVA